MSNSARLKAELLINDCERAIEKHSDRLQGEDFRLSWFSIICLLRAIGHVLSKVDSNLSSKHAEIIKRKYEDLKKSKPKPEIFWDFIDFERNRFLKEYDHGIKRDITFKGPQIGGQQIMASVDLGNIENSRFGVSEGILKSVIETGYFANRNEKEVAIEALDWWKEYIEEINKELRN